MTTMDRLFKKRLLARRKVGRAFVYAATATPNPNNAAFTHEMITSGTPVNNVIPAANAPGFTS